MKVLIIEDLQNGLTRYERNFKDEGYVCDCVNGYVEGAEKISFSEYDCILLNYKKDSIEIVRFLQLLENTNRREGLIVVSSEASTEKKVMLFNLGVDDYVTIPFEFAELDARIKAVTRRKLFQTKNKVYFANLSIELDTRTVLVWSTPINFTRKEYEIFLYLIANKDKVVEKIILAEYLWGNETDYMDSFNILSAHIKNIRKKMKDTKVEAEIKNSYGVGYQIIEL